MLEVIDKGSCSQAHPVPLLFVHGGWHGAWCWDDHFLDFFADAGYRAVATEPARTRRQPDDEAVAQGFRRRLPRRSPFGGRRPGWRPGADRPFPGRLRDPALPRRPSRPGRGAGGLTAAAAACSGRRCASGAAVLDDGGSSWSTTARCSSSSRSAALAREYLFCADTPETIVESCWDRAGPESIRAAMTDPMFRRVKTRRVRTPILVLGAERDGFVSVRARCVPRRAPTGPSRNSSRWDTT